MKCKSIFFFSCIVILSFVACSTTDQNESTTPTTMDAPKSDINYSKFGIDESSIDKVGALKIGSLAPDFEGKDQNGQSVQLSELTKDGAVVLVFYRGYWCPYCTRHLAAFVEEMEAIKAKGAQVIAIAPEGEKNIDKTVEKTGLEIPFISDSDNQIMSKYGVAFKVNKSYNAKFSTWKAGKSLASVNEQEEAYLPIPATYIIDQEGKIKWLHFNPDYSERSSVKDILEAL